MLTSCQLYTCEVPFARTPDKQVAALVLKGTRPERPSVPGNESESMADDLWTVLQQCWDADAAHRPKAYTLVEGLTAFANGGEETDATESEKATESITDEPDQMTSRSASPETVTSEFTQPDTPTDTPAIDASRAVRSQSVEDYSPIVRMEKVKSEKTAATMDDAPPPPYTRVDPSPRVSLAIVPPVLVQKSGIESTSSDMQDNQANSESSTEANPSSATTNNDQSNIITETLTTSPIATTEQVQVLEDHAVSGTVHDDHGRLHVTSYFSQ